MKIYLSKNYIILFLWCILIFIGSSIPGADVSKNQVVNFSAHKIIHLIEYAVLFVLAKRAFKSYLKGLVFCFLFALSDEFHQLFVKGREGKLFDVLVDQIGVLFGLIFLKLKVKVTI